MAPLPSPIHDPLEARLARGELGKGSSLGGYAIEEVLGRGGMGIVYRARDAEGRAVALKVVSRDLAKDSAFMARFRREGRVPIAHRNVVALLDAGEDGETPYLVFELVPGGTLKDRVRASGALPWREAASLGAEIARGLEAVHAQGLVHRDLKPENVLLDEKGVPKLSDFGLVGAQSSSFAVTQALTKTGELLGTLEYMAPEQADGKSKVGKEADLYALGALLHALLTGKPPFQGSGYALLKRHLLERPRPPSELARGVPLALDNLVLSLLEKKPERRPESARTVARELDAIARGRAGTGPRRAPLVALAAVVLVALGVSGWLAWQHGLETRAAEERAAQEREAAKKRERAADLADRAKALNLARKYDEALAAAHEALALDPTLARAWLSCSFSHQAKGQPDLAEADATRAVAADPSSPSVWVARASARTTLHQDAGAASDLRQALALEPRNADEWQSRGHARMATGDSKGGLADLTRAVELAPKDAMVWKTRADTRYGTGDAKGALADLERALALAPDVAVTWNSRGKVREDAGDLDGAIADFGRAIELAGGEPVFWENRAYAHILKQELDAAIADATRAVELDPRNHAAWVFRGQARYGKNDLDGAVEDVTRGIELAGSEARYFQIRAHVRRAKHDIAGARADYRRCLELAPSSPDADAARTALAELGEK